MKYEYVCTKCGNDFKWGHAHLTKKWCKSCRKAKKQETKEKRWSHLPPAKCHTCGKTKLVMSYYNPRQPVNCKSCCRKRKRALLERDNRDKYWWNYLSPEQQKQYVRRRFERLKVATPPWFETEEVKKLYDRAKVGGLHVDHVIPLFHPKVCGLHCKDNLQLLTPKENRDKGNQFAI